MTSSWRRSRKRQLRKPPRQLPGGSSSRFRTQKPGSDSFLTSHHRLGRAEIHSCSADVYLAEGRSAAASPPDFSGPWKAMQIASEDIVTHS